MEPTRAGREAGVPVAGDRTQEERKPLAELRIAGRDDRRARQRVDVRHVHPPGEQPHDRRPSCRGRRAPLVVPDHRDADRAGVEPLRVGADHVALDAAVPPLEDLAEAVDEEVVAHVVPAVSAHVVEVDPAHQGRGLSGRRRLGAGGVVDDRRRERLRESRVVAANPLVGTPRLAGDDRRAAGHLERAAHRLLRAPDLVRTQSAHPAAHADLEATRLAGPERRAEPPAAHPTPLVRAAIR